MTCESLSLRKCQAIERVPAVLRQFRTASMIANEGATPDFILVAWMAGGRIGDAMRYLKLVGTVLCALLAWIAWELREIAHATNRGQGVVEVTGEVGVQGGVTIRTEPMDPVVVEGFR
jgi:hypothetical protein